MNLEIRHWILSDGTLMIMDRSEIRRGCGKGADCKLLCSYCPLTIPRTFIIIKLVTAATST